MVLRGRHAATSCLALFALLAAACSDSLPDPPSDLVMTPVRGSSAVDTPVMISGRGLSASIATDFTNPSATGVARTVSAKLSHPGVSTPLLRLRFVGKDQLTAVVPAGLEPANYTLTLVDGFGRAAEQPNAFSVDAGACRDINTPDGTDCVRCANFRGCFCDDDGACKSRCGDLVIVAPEECDDGNTADQDGCSSTCGVEPGFTCTSTATPCYSTCGDGRTSSKEGCDDANDIPNDGCTGCVIDVGWTCTSTPGGHAACETTCGDRLIAGIESCDDGNAFANDGCSSVCQIEVGWACLPDTPCYPVCGDGFIKGDETCDDARPPLSGDGCDELCRREVGYACVGEPSVCSTVCGDGVIRGTEICDDGNTDAGDGCTACTNELGWSCRGEPSSCDPGCGDGTKTGREECDDHNLQSGDGCTSTCTLEPGWYCPVAGDPCFTVCGDAVVAGVEVCDDGNLTSGDGCESTCAHQDVGFDCPPGGGPCTPICGDGITVLGEACDDQNQVSSDGCTSDCSAIERGYTCPSGGGVCGPLCGDGLLRGTEQCDDGNRRDDDGCSSFCAREVGYVCPTVGQLCEPECGDGRVIAPETCDDSNARANDGCSATCRVETGWTCPSGQACAPICGDGLLLGTEACDDRNTANGDGCSSTCAVETGFSCTTAGQACAAICGDRLVRATETCDDGNTSSGDGCSSSCAVETGFACPTEGPSCAPICGDGLIRGAEPCDDHGVASGDGCSATCTIEPGYACAGEPSACELRCGNGQLDVGEGCDDGGRVSGDGCSSTCQAEAGFACMRAPSVCAPTLSIAFVDDTGPTCPTEGDGSLASPFCTMNAALASGLPYLFVFVGTYPEALLLEGRTVTIVAQGAQLDEVTRTLPSLEVRGGVVSVVGLVITGGTTRVLVSDADVHLEALRIGPQTQGIGVVVTGGSTVSIDRSTIIGNAGGGVVLDTRGPFVLTNDVFTLNGLPGISAFGGLYVAEASPSSRLANLTIVDNDASALGGVVAGVRCDAPVTISSSIVYGNRALGVASGLSAACSAIYSDVEPFAPGDGNFSAPPLLSADFHLLPGSPCIDLGDPAGVFPAGSAPPRDLDFETRPKRGRVDVGADELP